MSVAKAIQATLAKKAATRGDQSEQKMSNVDLAAGGASDAKKSVDVAAMFAGVKKSFRQLFLGPQLGPMLTAALEKIDPMDISPSANNILNFARYAELGEISVVIIGQDPYPNPEHAHGLSFSSMHSKMPASLRAVFDCLEHQNALVAADVFPVRNPHCLASWAFQGVLMLNMALTTQIGNPGRHLDIWKPFTNALVSHIAELEQPMVFILWGNHARELKSLIKNPKALILEGVHPSPMAQASLSPERKFKYCTHFSDANTHLRSACHRPIDWDPYTYHLIYTDGSASDNGFQTSKAGYAAYFARGPLMATKLAGRIGPAKIGSEFIFPTNQRAEGFAILMALERALVFGGQFGVYLVTDSMFWKSMIESYMPTWDPPMFESHANSDITKRMWKAVLAIKRLTSGLCIKHVYSHGKHSSTCAATDGCICGGTLADTKYNAQVDIWAKESRNHPEFFDSAAIHAID